MGKQVLILMVIFLGISISGFGQIKVNSAGKTFFGSGTGTTSYGAINLSADGITNGISFTGTSTNRYNLFKYSYTSSGTTRDELYITPNQSTLKGLKIAANGGVFMSLTGLNSASGNATLTVASSSGNPIIQAVGAQTTSTPTVIQSLADRNDAYSFSAVYRPDWSIRFYAKSDGTVYAKNGYIQSSDISKKEDVKLLKNSLDKISALSPVSFYYKDFVEQTLVSLTQVSIEDNVENDTLLGGVKIKPEVVNQLKKEASRKRIGLIAQEVEEIIPEVVRTLDDGTKGIMYSDLVALLIEGVKELTQIVEEQKIHILELEEKVNVIEPAFYSERKQIISHEKNFTDTSFNNSNSYLKQNAPNPFNQNTEIEYFLSEHSSAYIGIYNLNGMQIKKYLLSEKEGKITVYASDLNPGIYIYSLVIDNIEVDSKRMVVTD